MIQAKKKISAWRKKHEALVESINIAFAIFDPDYVLWYANDLLLELIGADAGDVERIENGFDLRDMTSDSEFKEIYNLIEPREIDLMRLQKKEKKKFYSHELSIRHLKTGESIPVLVAASINIDKSGIHDFTYVTVTDLREQKKIVSELADEKKTLQTILFGIGDCVSVYGPDKKLLLRNPRGKELLKDHLLPFLPLEPDSAKTMVMENKSEPRHFECLMKAIRNNQGEKVAFVETVKDITPEIKFKEQEFEFGRLKRKLAQLELHSEMIGVSRSMRNIFELVVRCAEVDSTVLIQGETGVGKELVARAIHHNSSRKEKPFVAVNCGALPEHLLESELFGHVKGAFTGAVSDRKGLFREATGGTIFLDEVGDLEPALQIKLLRTIQEREIRPVGNDIPIKIDVRIISSTNRDIKHLAKTGEYRQDLYYRLAVIPIFVPPLRERKDDILPLVKYFINKRLKQDKKGKNRRRFSHGAQQALLAYGWPGNIRELENTVEYVWAMSRRKEITSKDLPVQILSLEKKPAGFSLTPDKNKQASDAHYRKILKPWEEEDKNRIETALIQFKGNRTQTAAALGISRPTLWRRIKDYDIHF